MKGEVGDGRMFGGYIMRVVVNSSSHLLYRVVMLGMREGAVHIPSLSCC